MKAALAVDRLIGAGAVAFETSSVAPMLADWHSFDAIYGVTSNPHNFPCHDPLRPRKRP